MSRSSENNGSSCERCLWCGWTMGDPPLNCNNDDTPHIFRSTLAGYWWSDRVQALLATGEDYRNQVLDNLREIPTAVPAPDIGDVK